MSPEQTEQQTAPNPPQPQPQPQPDPKAQIGGRRCHINAFRHEGSGQFYAMSREDRQAFNQHYLGITGDLNPQTNRERWLATSIAEDQWRLNRARAIENNIFAIGMSGPIADTTHGDSPEVTAAACQARIWLQDGHQLQLLALFEQRIRRSVEKNEKQLRELQAERQAAFDQAVEEAILLAQLDLAEREAAGPAVSEEPPHAAMDGDRENFLVNGFAFSTGEINERVHRELRLRKARQLQKAAPPFQLPKAA